MTEAIEKKRKRKTIELTLLGELAPLLKNKKGSLRCFVLFFNKRLRELVDSYWRQPFLGGTNDNNRYKGRIHRCD